MRALAATQDRDHEVKKTYRTVFMAFIYLSAIVIAATAMGQTRKGDPKLKPRIVKLKTKDGIDLRAFYFPSDKGKDAPTVLIVHEWQGQASPYKNLVSALNKVGCAVLVPDYRGHGGSNKYINVRGETAEFNLAQMSRRDAEAIVTRDLEEAKSFLKDENNEGLLNMNALIVIGVREGCVLAANWAQRDWSFPSVGRIKQGQDVKALILISPEKQLKGLPLDSALTDRNMIQLPIMIVAGEDSPKASEARKIAKKVEGLKKRIGRGKASGFEFQTPNTALSGPSLVNNASTVIPGIVKFVSEEVPVGDSANPWVERE